MGISDASCTSDNTTPSCDAFISVLPGSCFPASLARARREPARVILVDAVWHGAGTLREELFQLLAAFGARRIPALLTAPSMF